MHPNGNVKGLNGSKPHKKTQKSKKKNSYDDLSLEDLAEIAETRGLGSEVQIIIRAL